MRTFCFVLSLQAGCTVIAAIMVTIGVVIVFVNTPYIGQDAATCIIIVWIIFLIITAVLAFISAYTERTGVAGFTVLMMTITILFWMVAAIMPFTATKWPVDTRRITVVCLHYKCAESLWLVEMAWRKEEFHLGEDDENKTTTAATGHSASPGLLVRLWPSGERRLWQRQAVSSSPDWTETLAEYNRSAPTTAELAPDLFGGRRECGGGNDSDGIVRGAERLKMMSRLMKRYVPMGGKPSFVFKGREDGREYDAANPVKTTKHMTTTKPTKRMTRCTAGPAHTPKISASSQLLDPRPLGFVLSIFFLLLNLAFLIYYWVVFMFFWRHVVKCANEG